MPVMLDLLSSELIDLIILYLHVPSPPCHRDPETPPPSTRLSSYATISSKWQYAVERYTFAAVKTFSTDLPRLKEIVGANRRRRYLVKELWYQIDLPLYSDNRRWCLERPREHKANLLAFQQGVIDLWTELSTWSSTSAEHAPSSGGGGMRLVLFADSPFTRNRAQNDIPHGGIDEDRWSYKEHRLTLEDEDREAPILPPLPSVTAIDLSPHGREFHPSAIECILLSLPNIRRLQLGITPPRLKSRALRTEHRAALAKALESPTLHQLECLTIHMPDYPPNDHSYQITSERDPSYPNGDVLNRAVSKLAQRSLRELLLSESYPISPALWGGSCTRESVSFPYLQRVKIDFPAYTYDGRWYFTGVPEAVEDFHVRTPESPREDDDSEYDSDQSYNSEYPDHVPFEREGVLNGQTPWNPWRTKPDPQLFDPLIRGLADAVLRMPRLKTLTFCVNLFGGADYEIEFECLEAGESAKTLPRSLYTETDEQRGKRRWVVVLEPEATWAMPEDIRNLMEEYVGTGGEVIEFQM